MVNPIESEIDESIAEGHLPDTGAPVARLARNYRPDSERLLGFLLSLDYGEVSIVTCDPWKRKCGGVPRNSFVVVKLSRAAVDPEDQPFCNRLMLARVTDSVPTPVERDIQATIFQIHKVQALLDPVTQKELQWSALKASIVGTYYDAEGEVSFGNDVDTFFAPHAYEVYVPAAEDLDLLLNSFVRCETPLEIGSIRYTETPTVGATDIVPVRVDPRDFVGHTNGQRTGLFGKTRFGKSNTIKVIADTVLSSGINAGQVIFDPSGEYTYHNPQDQTSLYLLHRDRCVRYSLDPREIRREQDQGLEKPRTLRINFYDAVPVGHSIMLQLWDSEHASRPGYMQPILNWSPPDLNDEPRKADYANHGEYISAYNHFWRTMSMWFAVLRLAGFAAPDGLSVPVDFQSEVKKALLAIQGVDRDSKGKLAKRQPVRSLPAIYRTIAELYPEHRGVAGWFPESSADGSPYFNALEAAFLQILLDDGSISGKRYLAPFLKYHDPAGSDTFAEIAAHAQDGKTIVVDFARADEQVRATLSERICRRILGDMMRRFSDNSLGDYFIVFYFEEAHALFRQDDRDLNSIYNKLAKEGAKFHISMVYATQSMTTLSPDLLKNTENFFIAHLDDDREIREVTRKYAFRDVAEDVQRTMSRGFMRMVTSSHRFALPVQIRRFEPRNASDAPGELA